MAEILFRNIDFSYNKGANIFENLNHCFINTEERGFIYSLIGASGAGKTTLLKLILGIEKPSTGEILLDFDKTDISYVPQEPVLFEHLSIEENARYLYKIKAYKNRFDENLYLSVAESLGVNAYLKSKQKINQLSGGEKQKLSLLRAMSIAPKVLLLDEPCTGLDSDIKKSFLMALKEITHKFNLLVLYITHHREEAEFISDEIAYMEKEAESDLIKVIISKPAEQFLKTPPTIEAARIFRFPYYHFLEADINEQGITFGNNLSFQVCITPENIYDVGELNLSGNKTHNLNLNTRRNNLNFLFANKLVFLEALKKNNVNLTGEVNVYDNAGMFFESIQISNEKIKILS